VSANRLGKPPDAPSSGLKILITNVVLNGYTGTEIVVRDLALELKRQGHSPFVFSKRLGPISHEISDQGIEVVSDLTALTVVPDVIHGHHHPLLLEALLQFPTVPAVWVFHDATSRFDEPFYSPRVLRYVAVDDRCRKRVQSSPDIPASKIDVIWNAVDLERFQPRDPLPSKPRRALVFSNQTAQLPVVRRAARRMGLKLETLGRVNGSFARNPESKLPAYDIVFAKARCALEAMAVGNAVVLCDFAGVGPMVTSENFDRLRCMNFGQGVLVNPLRTAHLEQEIERYDPVDAARVCRRVREEAGLPVAARRWLELYTTVRAEFQEMHVEPASELRSFAWYFRKWGYESRVDWEHEQLRKLEAIPVLGKRLLRLAKRLLFWWKDL
jgi:hypothetical protein